jgi:uncharacterized membrane protein
MTQSLAPVSDKSRMDSQTLLRRSTYVILSAMILLAGVSLRFYHLGNRSLWYDEAVTANISRGSFQQMLQLTRKVSAPIVHPFFLYLTERIASGAWMVRFPPTLASLAAVLMMLAMTKARINTWAVLFASAILSLSASQVRYAQEVREYSLAVFGATVLMFCLFRWEANSRTRQSVLLYAALFVAPFIQYGLVLLAVAVLITMMLRGLLDRTLGSSIISIVLATVCFLAGGILSYALTLRYQLQVKALGTQSYLAANYFDPKSDGVLHFLASNTRQLISFCIPGPHVVLAVILVGVVVVSVQLWRRTVATITLLLITSFAVTILASFRHVYPYGGVRQCLFLAPVLILFVGSVLADLLLFARPSHRSAAAFVVFGIIAISGARGISGQLPYIEIEDTQSLLHELAAASAPGDQVWVNHDAVDAFRFYLPAGDARFTYGKYHPNPNDYMAELLASVSPQTTRLWLAFSHLEQPSDHEEEQLILKTFPAEWKVEKRVSAINAELFLARRTTLQATTQ